MVGESVELSSTYLNSCKTVLNLPGWRTKIIALGCLLLVKSLGEFVSFYWRDIGFRYNPLNSVFHQCANVARLKNKRFLCWLYSHLYLSFLSAVFITSRIDIYPSWPHLDINQTTSEIRHVLWKISLSESYWRMFMSSCYVEEIFNNLLLYWLHHHYFSVTITSYFTTR